MSQTSQQALKTKLFALMVLRVAVAFVFLGVTVWIQLREGAAGTIYLHPLYAVVGVMGALTVFYAAAINRIRNLKLFAYAQFTVDAALITAIVYTTGGIASYLSVLYPFAVIGSVILLNKRGGYYTASISSISYGVLIDLDYYRILPMSYKVFYSPVEYQWQDVVTTVAVNMLAFFTVAYLVGYLSERTVSAEKELKEKEIDFDRLETLNKLIVDGIPAGVMTIDGHWRITSFNAAAAAITGCTLRDVYYRNADEIFHGLSFYSGRGAVEGVRFERDFEFSGKTAHLGFSVTEGKGGDMATIVIFQDLTQIKAMEEMLRRDEKLKALGELSASIAHEIRNPLASISGSVQVLRQDLDIDGEKLHLMDIVVRETERLNALITDFLLFAKPARGRTVIFDLSEALSETVKIFANSPQANGIATSTEISGAALIDGDRRQMVQVFWNIFINAASAMPGGGRLSVRLEKKDNGRAVINVSDTGKGIEPQNISRIFDPFFSTKDGGTGIGLALVHRIVLSHGGVIDVSSRPGEGTVFKIELPLASTAAQSENRGAAANG